MVLIYPFYLMACGELIRSIRRMLEHTKRRHAYGSERGQEVRAPGLFLHRDVGEILQHGMRGDGEDAGYYVPVRASELQR